MDKNSSTRGSKNYQAGVSLEEAVPNLFGARDWFPWMGRGDGSGSNASDAEQQMKPHSLAHCSPPAVWPGS